MGAIAAAKLLVQLLTSWFLPLHRDEIYMLACHRHLAWGSPDHAPLAPLLAISAPFMRVVAALAGTATVWWTARLTRRLGGGRDAQILAAGCALIMPVLLFQSSVYTTGTLDALFWIAACDLTVAAVDHPRRWWQVGVALGLGWLAKYTIVLCAGGLFFGLLAERRSLKAAWPALAVAAAIALPNLVWQAQHGLVALEFAASSRHWITAQFNRLEVVALQPFIVHPLAFAVAAAGLRRRLFAALYAFAFTIVVLLPGKPHYLLPAYLPLIAAGAIPAAAWLRPRRKLAAFGWLAAGAVGFAITFSPLDPEWAQLADWPAVVAQIPDGPVLTDSYGTAAALELGGRRVWSGANGYYLRPPTDAPDEVLVIGYDDLCRTRSVAGQVVGPDNRYDFPRTIWRCRLRSPLGDLWPRLRRYD
jgi:hypothetical protein